MRLRYPMFLVVAAALAAIGVWWTAAAPDPASPPARVPAFESPTPAGPSLRGGPTIGDAADPRSNARRVVDEENREFQREVELRVEVRRDGLPFPERLVRVLRAEGSPVFDGLTDADGVVRVALDPGEYVVGVPPLAEAARAEPLPPSAGSPRIRLGPRPRPSEAPFGFAASLAIALEPGDASRSVELHLPHGTAFVRAREAESGLPLAFVDVRARAQDMERIVRTDAAGRAVFEELPFAEVEFALEAPFHRAASCSRTLREDESHTSVAFVGEACGTLLVRLLDETDAVLEISAALRLVVTPLDGGEPLERTAPATLAITPRARELTYAGLAPGWVRVALEDEVEEHGEERAVRPQPLELVHPATVEVVAGERRPVDLHVRHRAHARVAIRDGEGRFAGRSTLRVLQHAADGTLVPMLPGPWQQGRTSGDAHFDGYLPPGLYTLIAESPEGDARRESLTVDRASIDATVTVPW